MQKLADEQGASFSALVGEALTGWLRGRLVDAWLAEHQDQRGAFTVAPVVGQVWRHGDRQAKLARLPRMIEVRTTALTQARAAGELLAEAGTSDVIDALLAMVAAPGDQVLTSDPDDLRTLADGRGIPLTVVAV